MSELNSYYEAYWKQESAKDWSPNSGNTTVDERRLFQTHLQPGKICLDYGCGNALRYGAQLAASGLDYRGFDISEQALREAKAGGLEVQQLTADGRTTLPDNSADAAICFEVLEHLMEPDAALREIQRCLKPGGKAILSVPNAAFIFQRLEFLFTGFWCPGGSPLTARKAPWHDPHIRFYHPTMLRQLVESTGLKTTEQFGEPFYLHSFPILWRMTSWHPTLNFLSKPFSWLGRVFPGLFSRRLFIVAEKNS